MTGEVGNRGQSTQRLMGKAACLPLPLQASAFLHPNAGRPRVGASETLELKALASRSGSAIY